jgi:hypothetical protein
MGPIATRSGHVYVVETSTLDQSPEGIWKYDPITGTFEQVAASTVPTGMDPPHLAGGGAFASLGFDDDGAPLVVSGHALVRPVITIDNIAVPPAPKVFLYEAAGSMTEPGDTDGLGAQARLSSPRGIWSRGVEPRISTSPIPQSKIRRSDDRAQPVAWIKPWIVSTVAGESDHRGTENGVGTDARLMRPHRLAVDGEGAILVAEVAANQDFYVDQVRRIDASGATSILTALPTYAFGLSSVSFVLRMAVADGTLFVTARSGYGGYGDENYDLLRFDAKSATWVSTDCDQPNDAWYSGLAYDGKEHLFVVDAKAGVVERFDVKAASNACSGGEPSAPRSVVATGLTAPSPAVLTSDAVFKGFRELAVDGERACSSSGTTMRSRSSTLRAVSSRLSRLRKRDGGRSRAWRTIRRECCTCYRRGTGTSPSAHNQAEPFKSSR